MFWKGRGWQNFSAKLIHRSECQYPPQSVQNVAYQHFYCSAVKHTSMGINLR